jgi:hypothetical protein
MELIKASRAAAMKIMQIDPTLKKHPPLKARLQEFQRGIHLE